MTINEIKPIKQEERYTLIRVSKDTRGLLNKIGRKGETYDDIIRELINLSKD